MSSDIIIDGVFKNPNDNSTTIRKVNIDILLDNTVPIDFIDFFFEVQLYEKYGDNENDYCFHNDRVYNDEEYFDVISIVKDYPEYFVVTYPEDDSVNLKNLVDEAGSSFIV